MEGCTENRKDSKYELEEESSRDISVSISAPVWSKDMFSGWTRFLFRIAKSWRWTVHDVLNDDIGLPMSGFLEQRYSVLEPWSEYAVWTYSDSSRSGAVVTDDTTITVHKEYQGKSCSLMMIMAYSKQILIIIIRRSNCSDPILSPVRPRVRGKMYAIKKSSALENKVKKGETLEYKGIKVIN